MRRASLVALGISYAFALHTANADEVVGLTTFTSGTPARAAEVNGNFQAVKTAVDDNDARIDALEEAAAALGGLMYGDGSAGDLVLTEPVVWGGAGAPTNLNFNNVTIESGATLTVASGTTIRCSGTFTNHGTITVVGLTRGGFISPTGPGGGAAALTYAHPGDAPDGATLPAYASGTSGTLAGGIGGTNISRTYVMSNLSSLRFGGSSGGGAVNAEGGAGGGVLRVFCNGAIQNTGTVTADGQPGAGGGGGGILALASRASITNTGTLAARGGRGNNSDEFAGASGAGSGGFVILISPTVTNTGTTYVHRGVAGSSAASVNNSTLRSGGGAGGGSAGVGGTGGIVSGLVSMNPEMSDDGLVLTLQNDPLYFVR